MPSAREGPPQPSRPPASGVGGVHSILPRAGRRQPRGGRVAPRAGPSHGLRGQATTEPVVHFYAAAPVHFYAAVDRRHRRACPPRRIPGRPRRVRHRADRASGVTGQVGYRSGRHGRRARRGCGRRLWASGRRTCGLPVPWHQWVPGSSALFAVLLPAPGRRAGSDRARSHERRPEERAPARVGLCDLGRSEVATCTAEAGRYRYEISGATVTLRQT